MRAELKELRSLRWLRRSEAGALARGLLWGLLLPAPCACALYMLASNFAPPLAFAPAPARPWPEVDSTAADAELSFALAPYLRGEATLIVGSSEMTRGRDATPEAARSAAERLDGCVSRTPLQSVAPAGHAARRAARLTERLQDRFSSARPVRLIVIDNSHYAGAAAQTVIEDRNYFLSEADYARFSLLRRTATPDAAAAARFFELRRLEAQSFRDFLGRRILRPWRERLFARYAPASDAGRASPEPAPVPTPAPEHGYLRMNKAFPADLKTSNYGRALAELSAAARRNLPPGSQWRALALPLNAAYFARSGFSPQEIAAMTERRRAVLQATLGPHLVYASELAAAELFVDSAHYTAAGRALLAETLCRLAGQMQTP